MNEVDDYIFYLNDLKMAQDMEELRHKIQLILIGLGGLTDFSFVLDIETVSDSLLVTNPQEQMDTYFSEGYQEQDFMVGYSQMYKNQPIFQSEVYRMAYASAYDTATFRRNREIIELNRRYGFYDYFCMQLSSILKEGDKEKHILFAVTQQYVNTERLQRTIAPITGNLTSLCQAIDYVIATQFQDFFIDGNNNTRYIVLNDVERQSLSLMSQGKKPKQVANELQIEVNSLYQRLYRLRSKFGLGSNMDLIREACKLELI